MTAVGGRIAIVAAYTTSQPWPANVRPPVGVHRVSQEASSRLGHAKPFVIDARKIAFMPLTKEFFPQMDDPAGGKVGRDRALADRVIPDLKTLSRSPGIIVRTGPLRPR